MSYADSDVVTVARDEAAALATQIAGDLWLPGDEGYAAECATFNLNNVLEPALVVGVTSVADVQAAVRFAARRAMPIAIKATAHQVVRPAHGAMLISTRCMNGVTIDAARRTARIEAGVRWKQVIDEAATCGLAPMNGSSPDVGAIGYTLGGGLSPAWSRAKGYAADHVISLDVVTADGELRHVTADREPDLFWALRGGKGNFGVVVAMVCELFPQTTIYGGGAWFPLARMSDVLPAWRHWSNTLPEEATTSIAVQRLPPMPFLPPPLQGASVLHVRFTHLGSNADGERLVAPIRAIAPSLMDTIGEMLYTSIGMVHMDPPHPIPYWDGSTMLRELPGEAIDRLIALTGPDSECPLISVEIRQLGGAMYREPRVRNAVPGRGNPYLLFGFGVGGTDQELRMRGYLDGVMQAMKPWADDRMLLNALSPGEAASPEGLRMAFGAHRYDRLLRVKRHYDPDNLFRMNHNIRPV